MAGWVKKANLRGPRGHGIVSAMIDAFDHLIIGRTDAGPLDAGNVRGPQGLPGVNALDNDAAVAGYIETPGTSATKSALLTNYVDAPLWKPGFNYGLGSVIRFGRDIFISRSAHTSGADFTFNNWKPLDTTFGRHRSSGPTDWADWMLAGAAPQRAGVPFASASVVLGATPVVTPGTTSAYDDPNVTHLHASPVLQVRSGADYYGPADKGEGWLDVELDIKGTPSVGVWLWSGVSNPLQQVFIDGIPLTRFPKVVTWASAARNWVHVILPDEGAHRVRVRQQAALFKGISAKAGATWAATNSQAGAKRVLWIGDSYTDSATYAPQPLNWPYLVRDALGFAQVTAGQGGTGYTTNGGIAGRGIFGDSARILSMGGVAPDYFVMAGSINDDPAAPATIQAAATTAYADIATAYPSAKGIVIGPTSNSSNVTAARSANRDAVKAAAASAPNVIAFIDPIEDEWIYGTGRLSNRHHNGISDLLIHTDGVHADRLGTVLYARRTIEELARVFLEQGLTGLPY